MSARPVLVTGGAGFIGSNLADRLAREGHDVIVFDALSRPGVARNLDWLRAAHPRRISFARADICDADALHTAAQEACAVFHLAAQVAVTASLADPVHDFDVNLRGTLVLLEALRRRADPPPLFFASTNKVYGGLHDIALVNDGEAYHPRDAAFADFGVSETRPLDFHTPYGCSKGAADQYVLDYARSFGLPAVVLRMSCIYGPRQMGTEDQGWLAHFLIQARAGAPITLFGDGRQVRDVLFVHDAVEAYMRAWSRIDTAAGCAINLGGGPANAVSLRRALAEIESLAARPLHVTHQDWRTGDQRWYVSDTRRAAALLGWRATTDWRTGLAALADWLANEERAAACEAAE